jgi:hypothetical protein
VLVLVTADKPLVAVFFFPSAQRTGSAERRGRRGVVAAGMTIFYKYEFVDETAEF